jgi:DNA-binding transcriptional regulator YiaG
MDDKERELLTPIELAVRLRVSDYTLRNWRLRGYGPPWAKIGKAIRYRLEDVRAWEKNRVQDFS